MNCVKHHLRKRDTNKRCFICIELGYLRKNYMNTRINEDEKKAKDDNIRKKMRQKWIPKYSKNVSLRSDNHVTQELGDSSISS